MEIHIPTVQTYYISISYSWNKKYYLILMDFYRRRIKDIIRKKEMFNMKIYIIMLLNWHYKRRKKINIKIKLIFNKLQNKGRTLKSWVSLISLLMSHTGCQEVTNCELQVPTKFKMADCKQLAWLMIIST